MGEQSERPDSPAWDENGVWVEGLVGAKIPSPFHSRVSLPCQFSLMVGEEGTWWEAKGWSGD